MHLIVIGAGIIGMTSAYALARRGHNVTVIDSAPVPGVGTSFANGAQLSYSFVAPLADPAVPKYILGWLTKPDSPLRFKPKLDIAQWRWLIAFLSACRRDIADRTTAELLQLGALSRKLIHEMVEREQFPFDFSRSGKLLVYQDEKAYQQAKSMMSYQASLGCEQQAFSSQRCVEFAPALSDIAPKLVGGIFTSSEDSGDCFALCGALRTHLENQMGVAFRLGTHVNRLHTEGEKITGLDTSEGSITGDGYVIANGVGAQSLCQQVGINPLIYPLKGYSLTYELTAQSCAPLTSLSDVHNKVVYARLGNRLRVAGMVDIGDTTPDVDRQRINSLKAQVRNYLPRLNEAGPPQEWAGLRPARPDSKPLIGRTPYSNLWLNIGHGALGFTLAAGSADLLVDRIESRPSTIADECFRLTKIAQR